MSGQCAVCSVQEMKDDETKTGCAMTINLTGGQAGEARRGEFTRARANESICVDGRLGWLGLALTPFRAAGGPKDRMGVWR